MAMFADVFEESIEQEDRTTVPSPLISSPLVMKDVNLCTIAEFNTPFNSPILPVGIQNPSPMLHTPECLFSTLDVETYESDYNAHTPIPATYCDFEDSSQSVDETMVPTTTLEDADITLTPEKNPGPNEDLLSITPLTTRFISGNETNSIYSNPSSILSTTTYTESSETSSKISTRKSKKRSDQGRKRNRHVENWQTAKRKRLCNMGQEYISKNGTIKEARKIKSSCSCRIRCGETFGEDIRLKLFSDFWNTGSHVKQWEIISKYVYQKNKKSSTNLENENVRRVHTLHYHLPLKTKSDNEITLKKVCKTMFLNTFSISKDFVYTALQKSTEYDDFSYLTDGRGRHKNHNKVITDEMKKSVIDHVNSYEPVDSHYVRKRSSIKYLDPSLSFSKMFKMYAEWCDENNYNSRVQTVRQYKDIVNENLKIGFHVPKKDQCDLCHQLKNTVDVSDDLKNKYENHQKEKEISRKLKLQNKLLASSDNTKACIVFDFQKVLTSPHGNTSIYYYKRKLNVYNFTVYNMSSKEAFCYMWDEQIAKRGANEVASCLYDFLSKLALKGVTEIYLWSDNCGGQNRNRIVFYMYLVAAINLNIKICHRFMEKGHTQNEGDSVHALIEKTAKGKDIYSPSEWYALVRWAKINNKPYNVIEVNQDMILDFKQCIAKKNWTKNSANNRVYWNKIKEIEASPEHEGTLFYKYSLDDVNSQQIQCYRNKGTRKSRPAQLPDKAYTHLLKINKAKYTDLVYFCNNNIIPQRYHSFYTNLTATEVIDNQDDVSEEED